jgi:hypothetical protein
VNQLSSIRTNRETDQELRHYVGLSEHVMTVELGKDFVLSQNSILAMLDLLAIRELGS